MSFREKYKALQAKLVKLEENFWERHLKVIIVVLCIGIAASVFR
jgi:hypothetical protein